jgi:1-acyl-sn-glycerol-3-phosphate acyltransferase
VARDPADTQKASSPQEQAAPPSSVDRAVGATGDRSWVKLLWYRLVQCLASTLFAAVGGWRATGRQNVPKSGGLLLVANHLSFLDVFMIGIPLRRPLNYVARSTLFVPGLSFLMRSVGGFPIQREGIGTSGLRETLRKLRNGGAVILFPEGTRSPDGNLGPLKAGIAVLVSRARVPVVPAGIAGTFEAWPRTRLLPVPHPVRLHYGPPILPSQIEGLEHDAVTALIRDRLEQAIAQARAGLARDLHD